MEISPISHYQSPTLSSLDSKLEDVKLTHLTGTSLTRPLSASSFIRDCKRKASGQLIHEDLKRKIKFATNSNINKRFSRVLFYILRRFALYTSHFASTSVEGTFPSSNMLDKPNFQLDTDVRFGLRDPLAPRAVWLLDREYFILLHIFKLHTCVMAILFFQPLLKSI